jgi:uncharacterized protein YjbI with pentapeptide repeats
VNAFANLPARPDILFAALGVFAAVIVLLAIWHFYTVSIRPNRRGLSDPYYNREIAHYAASVNELLSGLWSADMNARLAALLVAKRLSDNRKEAAGIETILIAFIRHRLSADKRGEIFEDVRAALDLLSLPQLKRLREEHALNVDLSQADFRNVPLAGADFREMNLARCNFSGCNLSGAHMEKTNLSSASLNEADLTGAVLANAQAMGADFSRAAFAKCDLSGADLSGADLSDADLSGARLRGAKFQDTDISGAILIGAGGLSQKQLDDAFGDANTAVPDSLRFSTSRSRSRALGTVNPAQTS